MFPGNGYWYGILDGDPRGYDIYKRHYTFREFRDNRRRLRVNLFVGPGEKMVLLGKDGRALFVWRKFKDDSGQVGVNCAVFRNEGAELSSQLILEAEGCAANPWPGERLYTYVDPASVSSPNPGYCFKMAGWVACGKTKGGLTILEKIPAAQPPLFTDAPPAPREVQAGLFVGKEK